MRPEKSGVSFEVKWFCTKGSVLFLKSQGFKITVVGMGLFFSPVLSIFGGLQKAIRICFAARWVVELKGTPYSKY